MADIELRPVSRDDAELIWSIVLSAELHDGVPRVLSLAEVTEEFDEAAYDPALDARIALIDGEPVGWGRVWHAPSDGDEDRAYLYGDVVPHHRGRGVGRALLAWTAERAYHRLSARPAGVRTHLRVQNYDFRTDCTRLYRAAGFVEVRRTEELLRPVQPLLDVDPPAGIRLAAATLERSEEIRATKNAAFADHWGSVATPASTWTEMMTGHGRRLDLSFVALDDDDRIVAHCLNSHYPDDVELLGRRDGWIDSLGTRRDWRGRGVATVLIAASLRAFADAGLSHAALAVDSASQTGANRLYAALGFERQHTTITFELNRVEGHDGTGALD